MLIKAIWVHPVGSLQHCGSIRPGVVPVEFDRNLWTSEWISFLALARRWSAAHTPIVRICWQSFGRKPQSWYWWLCCGTQIAYSSNEKTNWKFDRKTHSFHYSYTTNLFEFTFTAFLLNACRCEIFCIHYEDNESHSRILPHLCLLTQAQAWFAHCTGTLCIASHWTMKFGHIAMPLLYRALVLEYFKI